MRIAALAIASVGLGRTAFARINSSESDKRLNRRAESYIGRMFTLDGAIVDGRGRLKVDDTVWLVAGPDLPAGTRVRGLDRRGICNVESRPSRYGKPGAKPSIATR